MSFALVLLHFVDEGLTLVRTIIELLSFTQSLELSLQIDVITLKVSIVIN
jgi:hypothetical protein